MGESNLYHVRLGELEEVTLQSIKAYIADFNMTTIDKVTDSEALKFAIRCTGTKLIEHYSNKTTG